MGKFNTILARPVNIRDLVDNLEFDVDDLERAALVQPKYFLEASRYRTLKLRKRARAYVKLELLKAEAGMQLRRKKADKKLTEAAINSQVLADEECQKWRDRLEQAYVEEKYSELLVEAYKQRLSVIKVLSDIRNSEISSELRAVRQSIAADSLRKVKEKVKRRGYGNEAMGSEEE